MTDRLRAIEGLALVAALTAESTVWGTSSCSESTTH